MIKKLLGDKIAVIENSKEKVTAGGIYVPDSVENTDATIHAVIKHIGTTVTTMEVGQTVLINKFGASIVLPDGEDTIAIIQEQDVLGIVE